MFRRHTAEKRRVGATDLQDDLPTERCPDMPPKEIAPPSTVSHRRLVNQRDLSEFV
jgi:hypothetical protein